MQKGCSHIEISRCMKFPVWCSIQKCGKETPWELATWNPDQELKSIVWTGDRWDSGLCPLIGLCVCHC